MKRGSLKVGVAFAAVVLGIFLSRSQDETPEQRRERIRIQGEAVSQHLRESIDLATARAQERLIWVQSNRAAFGTNWQVVVYGSNVSSAPLTNAVRKSPHMVVEYNGAFLKRHPEFTLEYLQYRQMSLLTNHGTNVSLEHKRRLEAEASELQQIIATNGYRWVSNAESDNAATNK